jgi:hypothetical protein
MLIDTQKHRKRIAELASILALISILIVPAAMAQMSNNVERELETTDRLIDRATEAVREAGSIIGQQHLDRAVVLQRKAHESHRSGMYRRASTLTIMAREQAKKAIGAIQLADRNSGIVRREIERTDDLLNNAQDLIRDSQSQKTASLLEQAIKTQTEGKEFFHGNRLKIALKATLKARETARKAIDIAGIRSDQASQLQREISRTDELIARAAERADELGVDGQVHVLLDNARQAQQIAKERLEALNYRIALSQTKKARESAKEALSKMESDVQPERIDKMLQQNDRLVESVREMLREHPNAKASELVDVAANHLRKAKEALAKGKDDIAIVEAKAARDLAERARNMVNN